MKTPSGVGINGMATFAAAGTSYLMVTKSGVKTNTTATTSGLTLPQASIAVASTSGFASSGTIVIITSAGPQLVTYTGTSGGNTFTGCTGGTAAYVSGAAVADTGYIPSVGVAGSPMTAERMVLTSVMMTTSDTTPEQVTIDDGSGGIVMMNPFVSSTAAVQLSFQPDTLSSRFGIPGIRATVAGLTASKSLTVQFWGYATRT